MRAVKTREIPESTSAPKLTAPNRLQCGVPADTAAVNVCVGVHGSERTQGWGAREVAVHGALADPVWGSSNLSCGFRDPAVGPQHTGPSCSGTWRACEERMCAVPAPAPLPRVRGAGRCGVTLLNAEQWHHARLC